MTKTAVVRARMEPRLKKDAEQVMADIGLSPTEAIRLFYRQVTLTDGLPFEVRKPNAEMRRVIADTRTRKNLKTFKSVAEQVRAVGHKGADEANEMQTLKADISAAIKSLDAGKGKTLKGARQLAAFLRTL